MMRCKKPKGKHRWCPGSVIDELEDIKREDGLNKDNDAFNRMVKYTRVGRETKRLANFDFSKAIKRPPVPDLTRTRKKKKKHRGFLGL